jgi:hypothetical protein
VLDALEEHLRESKVGLLEISDCSAADEMKIFEIINSGGTQLTSAEILSAKASWNVPVENPHPEVSASKDKLHESLEIPVPDDVRRWDVAASLLDRIEASWLFGGFPRGERGFEKRTKLGFQLMSAYYQGRLMKDDLESLAEIDRVPWGSIQLESAISTVANLIAQVNVFKYWQTWHRSIMEILSDAIAIDFLVILLKDWERKAKPTQAGIALKQLQRNAVILLDRLVFEYVTGQWRGSSDSRIAGNLTQLAAAPEVFPSVEASDWERLIDGVVDTSQINGQPLLTDRIDGGIKVLLHYYYIVRGISGPSIPGSTTLDWDHIIPQAAFEESGNPALSVYMNHIANVSYLPSRENKSKRDKRLNEITDYWLRDQITTYEEIPPADFERFSTASSVQELILSRGGRLKTAFREHRAYMVANLEPKLAG